MDENDIIERRKVYFQGPLEKIDEREENMEICKGNNNQQNKVIDITI